MSAQTNSLSLVFISEQEKLAPVLATLVNQGFCVEKYSSSEWLERNSRQHAPDLVFINPLITYLNVFSTFAAQFDLARSLVIVSGDKNCVDLDIVDPANLCCWPAESQAAIHYLNNTVAAENKLAKNRSLREEFVGLNLVGSSPQFLASLKKVKKISQFDAPVLIKGETGTGKEMAARAIHYLSDRRDNPFIPVDCGAIPDNLIENELFGHERGAYTDARQAQRGMVNQAEGGTLFLDEIDALSSKAQVTLLRFLQSREYRPLGSQRSRKANIRIIAATNADLTLLVSQERFRQDLLFRIDVLGVELPPLRQRSGDVENLSNYFLEKYRRQYNMPGEELHNDTLVWMHHYHWPGNVRELENFIHREFLLCENGIIKHDQAIKKNTRERRVLCDRRLDVSLDISFNEAKEKLIEEFEKKYLRQLMQVSSGNVTKAARISGKERRALGKLLKKHGIDKDEFNLS